MPEAGIGQSLVKVSLNSLKECALYTLIWCSVAGIRDGQIGPSSVLVNIDGPRLSALSLEWDRSCTWQVFRIPTVWFETYKDPFLCKLLNFIRTNLQGIHQIQKESHWIKVVRLLLSRIQIGATTKVFSAGPYCGSRSALRLSGDGWPSEGSCSSSHLRLNSIYHTLKSGPPTPRRRQAWRWQRFQGDFTARAQPLAFVWWGEVCLILITELRAQLKRDASAFIIVLHQTVCLRDGLSTKEIRGFIQDKTKDAVMIKRNWNWQNFICFLIFFCWDVGRMGGAIWSSNCAW